MLNWGSRLRCKLLIWEPTLEEGSGSGILNGHPQSIVQIQEKSFCKVVENGRIDERFIAY